MLGLFRVDELPTVTRPLTIRSFWIANSWGAEVVAVVFDLLPRLEKFHLPEDERSKTSSGSFSVRAVRCTERESNSGISSTLTSTDFALRNDVWLKAGSSAMLMSCA